MFANNNNYLYYFDCFARDNYFAYYFLSERANFCVRNETNKNYK